jgi:PIN domain nuclease of toxin-antitoxin system
VIYLLDTQAFLWFVLNDSRLASTARALMIDPANLLLLSPASYWEVAIKVSIGKYQLNEPFETFMEQQLSINRIEILPIHIKHVAATMGLPFHHKDPFDRLLVAQAMVEGVCILSGDSILEKYPVTRVW